ncbi:MAG: bi-domain-containing oxidoreductase [Gemmatimonadetes bacterium]|nr:bi-domain-containing oxidoreductase [Gemmatimonadota bacterium]
MKQVVRRGIGEIIVDDVPAPGIPEHHVLVRPLRSLISSGTETASLHTGSLASIAAENPSQIKKVLDLMSVAGPARTIEEVRAKLKDYAVLGYSGAGVVAAVHPSVRDLEPGARVAYGGEGTGHGEYIVTGRNLVARVPDEVDYESASFSTLGAIAMNAVRVAEIDLGDRVAVVGLGLVGQLTAQLARLRGARVLALDIQKDRIALAEKLGAEAGITGSDAAPEQVRELTEGRGADCVIVCAAAKSDVPMRQALSMLRDRGRVVVVGAVEMHYPWLEAYLKEARVLMARAYGPGSYDEGYERKGRDYPLPYVRWTENRNQEEFLRLIGTGDVDVRPLITHRYPLVDAAKAYETIMTPGSGSLAVVLSYGEQEPPRERTIPTAHSQASATKGTLKVALVGPGNILRWAHVPALREVRDAKVVAVYSSNGVRSKAFAERYKAGYATTELGKVMGDPGVDAVLITGRNNVHAAQAIAAVEHGKHAFVEKPLALTDEECQRIWAAAKGKDKLIVTGFNRRFAPDYRRVKAALDKRQGPAVLSARVTSPGIAGGYWMSDPKIGGAILGEACHFVDLFYWLLGSEFVSVSAFSLPPRDTDPIGSNNMACSFRFVDGSVANLTYCTVGHKSMTSEKVEAFAVGIATGTEDFKRSYVAGQVKPASRRWLAAKGYNDQMLAFAAAVRGEKPPAVTLLDGIRSSVACLRMLDSAAADGAPQAISLEPYR